MLPPPAAHQIRLPQRGGGAGGDGAAAGRHLQPRPREEGPQDGQGHHRHRRPRARKVPPGLHQGDGRGRTVVAIASKQNRLTPTLRERERGALFIALFRWLLFFSFFWRPFPCPPFDTWPFSLLLSPLIFSLGVFPRRRSRNDGGDSRGENCQDTQLDASRGQRQDGQGRIQEAPATKGMYRIR